MRKIGEYPYRSVERVYKGPVVYYEDWCNFCKEKGVQGVLVAVALSVPLGGGCLEGVIPEGAYVYACGAEYKGETLKMRRNGCGTLKLSTGDVYEGSFKHGHRFGHGKLTYPNSTGYYQGEWVNDLRHGPGEELYPDGGRFQGIWKQGKQAYGTLEWQQGETQCKYEGGFDEDKFDGFGIWTDGVKILEGYWKNSLLEGEGKESFMEKGSHYNGGWKQGKYHGKGELVNEIGKYNGAFLSGFYHGYGELLYNYGSTYKGEWKNGMFHGKGEHINAQHEAYTGEFVEGKRHGYGVMQYANKSVYQGNWETDKRHGTGEINWESGDSYVGQFVNNKYEGKGKLMITIKEGTEQIYEGTFVGGLAEGKGTLIKTYQELIAGVKKREVYVGDFTKGEFDGIFGKPKPCS